MSDAPKNQRLVTGETTATASALPSSLGVADLALTAPGPEELLPLRERARYEILSEHARGGLGRVWQARDLELDRVVALKEMLATDATARSRFVREVRVTARLQHPAIVPIHEAGRWSSGGPFYVMKLVTGRTLREVGRDSRTLRARMALLPNVIAVIDAMAYAHAQRVVHRDLTPSNVIIGAYGETVIIDWGLAKDLRAPATDDGAGGSQPPSPDATRVGHVIGTPGYMAPEQARGEPADERSDIYALGALLYFVLAGRAPHVGADAREILDRVRSSPAEPLRRAAPDVPVDLAAIVDKAVAADRADRYESAEALAADLKRFQTGQAVSAHAYSVAQHLGRWIGRHRGVSALSALFLLAAAIGGVTVLLREQRLRRAAEAERDRADAQTLALLATQGKSELAAGRPFRAAPYLVEALRRKPSSVAFRSLVSQAVRPIERLQGTLGGHVGVIASVSFTADGASFATAGDEGTVRVWSSADLRLRAVVPVGRSLGLVALSPDRSLVAAAGGGPSTPGSDDDFLTVRHVDSGKELWSHAIPGTTGVWFTPDGTRVVLARFSGELRLYDAASGGLLAAHDHYDAPVVDVAFAPDGSRFVVAARTRVATLWDTATFRPAISLPDHDGNLVSVAFSRDGAWLLTIEDAINVHVRRGRDGTRVHTVHLPEGANETHGSFSGDGRSIILRSTDGIVRTVHTASGVLLDAFDADVTGFPWATALRPDGKQLVVGGYAGLARVWALDRPGWRAMERTPDDRTILCSSQFVADARVLAGDSAGNIFEWDRATGDLRRAIRVDARTCLLFPNRDASRVIVVDVRHGKQATQLWDLKEARRVAVDLPLLGFGGVSVDGRTAALARSDGGAQLIDTTTGALGAAFAIDGTRKVDVAWHPQGRELAVGSTAGVMYRVDTSSGRLLQVMQVSPHWIAGLAYTPDGNELITADGGGRVLKIWDTATGAWLRTVEHDTEIAHVSISADGRWLAVGDGRGVSWVLDYRSGERVRTIPGADAVFSQSGKELLAAGWHGYAVVWDMTIDERSPEELARVVAAGSPWELVNGELRRRPPAVADGR